MEKTVRESSNLPWGREECIEGVTDSEGSLSIEKKYRGTDQEGIRPASSDR